MKKGSNPPPPQGKRPPPPPPAIGAGRTCITMVPPSTIKWGKCDPNNCCRVERPDMTVTPQRVIRTETPIKNRTITAISCWLSFSAGFLLAMWIFA